MRSQIARREQEEAIRRQDEAVRRGLQGPDRPTLERYQYNLVRGEPGMPGLRREREGEDERRAYGYEHRR